MCQSCWVKSPLICDTADRSGPAYTFSQGYHEALGSSGKGMASWRQTGKSPSPALLHLCPRRHRPCLKPGILRFNSEVKPCLSHLVNSTVTPPSLEDSRHMQYELEEGRMFATTCDFLYLLIPQRLQQAPHPGTGVMHANRPTSLKADPHQHWDLGVQTPGYSAQQSSCSIHRAGCPGGCSQQKIRTGRGWGRPD